VEEIFYDAALVTAAWVESVRRLLTERFTARRVLRFAQAARRHSLEHQLGEIRMPTLMVWGKEDQITPIEVGERFHALVADSQFWTLTNCGHAPMLEQPYAFNAIVREWLYETWDRRAQLSLVSGKAR
jgi:pimeloyl-ACP methyl ester carboxylesterase